MPTFELQGSDGKTYEAQAPDMEAAVAAFKKMPQPNMADTISGLAKATASGVGKGAAQLAGMPIDVANALGNFSDWAASKITGQAPRNTPDLPGGASDIQKVIEGVTGEFYKPQTTPEKFASSIGEFVPGSLIGPGGVAAKVGRYAVLPGAASEAAGELTAGTSVEPWARAGAGIAAAGVNPSRLVTPNPITPERQHAVDILRGEGVNAMTAGQVTGRTPLRYTESVLADAPWSGRSAETINRNVGEQFTSAALRRVGEDAPRANTQVIDGAFRRIGNEFDTLSARNVMQGDAQLGRDIHDAYTQYASLVPPSQRSPIIETIAQEIGDAVVANGGALPGEAYQALRSRLSRASRESADPQLSRALSEVTESLDDAMARSIQATNPRDAGGFEQARRQYRNLLVIEKAATGAGEEAASGIISPAALANATKNTHGRRAYARGQGEFSELAHAGTEILSPLKQSGTGPREAIQHHIQLAALLGGAGHIAGEGPGAAIGAALGIAGPAVASRAVMHPAIQAYLSNQLIHGAPTDANTRALIASQLIARMQQPSP